MRTTDEASLVEAARAGDSVACENLFEAYQSKVYNYSYSICGNAEDAKDIAQDAFIKVFEALPKIEGELKFSAYLYRTAHNSAIDSAKARTRFSDPDELEYALEEHISADPERVALVKEQQSQVRTATLALRDEHREILTLREVEGMSYEAIGDILDMPKNTVGVLLSRARLKFKGAFRMSAVDVDKLTEECRTMLPLISAYIDDELSDSERDKVEAHLDDCPLCRLAMEEMTEASASYRGLIPLLPPAGLKIGVLEKLAHMPHLTGEPPGPSAAAETSKISSKAGEIGKSGSEAPTFGEAMGEAGPNIGEVAKASSHAADQAGGIGGGDDLGSRLLSRLTPPQKILIATGAAMVLIAATVGVLFGLRTAPAPSGVPLPPVSGVVPGSALQTISPQTIKPGDPTVEEAAVEQVQVDEGTPANQSQSQPSTEPSQGVQGPPDESQLGDQPGDVNLPDNPDQTSPDY